jgi:multiple sugar transport system ATP-binding protein
MFVADFIGSPAMNFLRFEGVAGQGDTAVTLGDATITLPQLQESAPGKALALGVRPEHVQLTDAGQLRGRTLATEYLGTTQIVTIDTAHGTLKARAPASQIVKTGETVGLNLTAQALSLFDTASGRALRTAANAKVLHG